jgi:hypothetical protein
MIRCVRIWTGPDRDSLFEEGTITLPGGGISLAAAAVSLAFRETGPGGAFTPHQAPVRQYVLTLTGTLAFRTASGATFHLYPGDVLLAEDTTGTGHSWRLEGDQPWRRAYVVLAADAIPLFTPGAPS